MKNLNEKSFYLFLKNINYKDKNINLNFFKDIINFLISAKKILFFDSNFFLNQLNNKIFLANLDLEIKNIIFFFINNFKNNLKIKNHLKIYNDIFSFFLFILNSSKNFLILYKGSKKLNFEKKEKLELILKKYSINSTFILEKIDKNLYSGFQIYFKDFRLESNYRRISNDLFNLIEKDINRIKDE